MRRIAAARLADGCVRELRRRPPEIVFLGARVSQEVKCFSVAQRLSGDAEYQSLQGELSVSLWYYYDASNASRPQYGGANINMDVYLQMMGDDPDVVLGGDMAKFDFRPELRRITAPMLITAGRFDRVAIPRFAVQFREHAPQADFVVFERSGHSPHREETALYFRTVRDFLRRPLGP